MRVKYPIQVDPATILLQLCLQVEPKRLITSDDVMKEVLSARGSVDRISPRCYRIGEVRDIKIGVIVDEGRHEIEAGEFESRYGCDAVVKALQVAKELTLSAKARIEARDCVANGWNGLV